MPIVTPTSQRPQVLRPPLSPRSEPELLLTPQETAIRLRVSGSFLAKARMTGSGPRFRKFGRSVRYAVQDLIDWERSRSRGSTSEY